MTFISLFTQIYLGLHAALTIIALIIGGAAITVFFYEFRNDQQRKKIFPSLRDDDFTALDE